MSLSQSTDASSSTLGESRALSPPYHPLSPPPRRDVDYCGKKTPTQLDGNSGVLAFSKEVDDALATPESVISPGRDNTYLGFCHETTPDDGHAEVAHAPDKLAEREQKKDLKLSTASEVPMQFDTPLSPQPKSSISKVCQISGAQNVPTFRETTPTGHNSQKKIHKLTGLGLPPELAERRKQIQAEHRKQVYGEISPLSNTGSEHSNEGPLLNVSDLDGNTEVSREYSSEPSSGYFSFEHSHRRSTRPSAIPSLLRAVEPARPSRSPDGALRESHRHAKHPPRSPLTPRLENAGFGPDRDALGSESAPELYHEAARELAKEDALATQQATMDRAMRLAAHELLQAGRKSSVDSHQSSRGRRVPSLSFRHLQHQSLDGRASDSAENTAWRPSSFQEYSPRAVSASTFGRLPQLLRAQLSASPSPPPDLRPYRHSGYNRDSTDDDPVGTPETGGSIPISVASEISAARQPDSPTAPRRRSYSSSVMARVFRRSSASPATPTPPSNSPVRPSRPGVFTDTLHRQSQPHRHRRHHHDRYHVHRHPLPTITTDHHQPASQPLSHPNPPMTPSSPRQGSKSPMSALAAKTSDLVGAAAGFLGRSTSSLGGNDRRRQQLKNRIRVLPDGRQVQAPKAGFGEFGTGPGAGSSGSDGVGGDGRGGGGGGGGVVGGSGPAADAPATFWAGQPGDGSVWGGAAVTSPVFMGGTEPENSRLLQAGLGEGMGREVPEFTGPGGMTSV